MASLASRGLLRSLRTTNPALRIPAASLRRSQLCTLTHPQHALRLAKPALPKTLALVRWQSSGDRKNVNQIDEKHEHDLGEQKLEVHPELVSMESSSRPIMSETADDAADSRAKAAKPEEEDTDMMAGIRSDFQTIKDTFSLEDVPRQAYYVGMAGVLPYLATSLSTVYCAYEIHHGVESGSGLLISEKTAELALHVIEPIQVGYGAVIISFLGAIHWGLEWAAYGGIHGYPRYMIGIVSTALAWPTLLLPVEYALISQFLIFNFLYYSDARACKRGWTPPWYNTYRFVLTFIVGGSIVVSLIGRGQIADKIEKLPSPADRVRALRNAQYDELENEEQARRRFLSTKDDDDEEEEEEEEEE
ncbi:hypothetical protein LTR53_009001 [Teratosphaeriaceae sp. CCFEE 6253]|nr:hypothetical protein LTR53_009001 [Teratosphaeriaceae sp. CCFEE 6253]